jgi:hypothetical protein
MDKLKKNLEGARYRLKRKFDSEIPDVPKTL